MSETAKAIAKRLKNKGLQRLRWYCEMCKKQCRDENGFRNHCTTEGHLREMEKFSGDSATYIEKFSRDFEKAYLDVLSRNHHTKRVNANYVYNELIQDKQHVHMSATRWDSLANFVKYLGDTGRCEVEETERGWFVKWIDPEELARESTRKKREAEEARVQNQRTQMLLKQQRDVASATINAPDMAMSAGENETEDTRIVESEMVVQARVKRPKSSAAPGLFHASEAGSSLVAEETIDRAEDDAPSWLMNDIVVRINSGKVGNGLKNEKAVVLDVRNDHADLILLRTGQDVSDVPSKRLETVIPKVGGRVMVLGLHKLRGKKGSVRELSMKDCSASVILDDGNTGTFEFEDISKIFDEDSD